MSIKRWKLGWKRCDCVKCEAALTIEQTEEDCGWVRWGDHKEENARLKAEVERLRKFNDEALAHIAKEERKSRECLGMAQADVERLIKAGDEVVSRIEVCTEDLWCSIHRWNAAKEASQA